MNATAFNVFIYLLCGLLSESPNVMKQKLLRASTVQSACEDNLKKLLLEAAGENSAYILENVCVIIKCDMG